MPSKLAGEYWNIALLLVLYTLQGIPMGLGRVVPMILKERGATFSELGYFSLQSWPMSLKLLWAPLVDTIYVARFGRRKTWMVPAQILIGIIMIMLSTHLNSMLMQRAVMPLTLSFFALNALAATQDIAVDGWALTMCGAYRLDPPAVSKVVTLVSFLCRLRQENAGYQATCNAVGQTFGFTLGWTGVTVLEQLGIIGFEDFMFYAGVGFIAITLLVAVLKAEVFDLRPPDASYDTYVGTPWVPNGPSLIGGACGGARGRRRCVRQHSEHAQAASRSHAHAGAVHMEDGLRSG